MGRASKEEMKVVRAEAAERLRALATHIEQGLILLGREEFKVPEEVRLEIKADTDELDVELKWRPSASLEEERRDEEKQTRSEHASPR